MYASLEDMVEPRRRCRVLSTGENASSRRTDLGNASIGDGVRCGRLFSSVGGAGCVNGNEGADGDENMGNDLRQADMRLESFELTDKVGEWPSGESDLTFGDSMGRRASWATDEAGTLSTSTLMTGREGGADLRTSLRGGWRADFAWPLPRDSLRLSLSLLMTLSWRSSSGEAELLLVGGNLGCDVRSADRRPASSSGMKSGASLVLLARLLVGLGARRAACLTTDATSGDKRGL